MKQLVLCLVLGLGSWGCQSTGSGSRATENSMNYDSDRFVSQAMQGGMLEIELSQVAFSNATSEALRNFAGMMINDHGKANLQLEAIARAKHIIVPSMLDSDEQAKLAELRNASGSSFDSKYYKMQVEAHDKAIDLFELAADDNSDAELRAFAKKTLPILQKHRDDLKKINVGRSF